MTCTGQSLAGSRHVAVLIVQFYSLAFGHREFCKEAFYAPHTLSVH